MIIHKNDNYLHGAIHGLKKTKNNLGFE